ncbi:MAG: endonuclease Q family protein, partial [Methanomicrobiales archaeon]|nr:endonuclease Q family protein [Methanomicrobiales archaeon]
MEKTSYTSDDMLVNADLHIHSPFSIGTSRSMDLPRIRKTCARKGIQVLGSGDGFHPIWRKHCRSFEEIPNFLLIPSVEVEDLNRIHHLILLEEFTTCADLVEIFRLKCAHITTSGRPHIIATGEEIAREVHARDGLIGPAHAFTPWTSLFARFSHVKECYGDEPIDFLELGLSADSSYAERIPDLGQTPFLSNSDAHGPGTDKIGREWNQLEVSDMTVQAVLESISRGRILYNAGFFPEVGKYNRTACSRCYRQFSFEDAVSYSWRCPDDRGFLKKGVSDRVKELSGNNSSLFTRPPYHHIVPLEAIIQAVLGMSSPSTKRCQQLYELLLSHLGTEIEILTKTPQSEICTIHHAVGRAIQSLCAGEVKIQPGGGGRYGSVFFDKEGLWDLP